MTRFPGFARRLLAALVLAVAASAGSVPAAAVESAEIEAKLGEMQRRIERAAREVDALKLTEPTLQRLNAEALAIRDEALVVRDQAAQALEERRPLLDALGPKPATGEPAAIAEQRTQLEASVGEAEGWGKRADVILARVDQVLDNLSGKRVSILARELGSTKPVPVDPRNWVAAGREVSFLFSLVSLSYTVWGERLAAGEVPVREGARALAAMALIGFAAGALASALARRRLRQLGAAWGEGVPPAAASGRVALAAVEAALRLLPWVLALLLAARALPDESVLPNAIAMTLGRGLVVAASLLVAGLVGRAVVLAPTRPQWRLATLDDSGAARVSRAAFPLLLIVAVDIGVVHAGIRFETVETFLGVWTLVATVAIFLAARHLARALGGAGASGGRPLRFGAQVALGAAVIAAIGGYAALAQFVALGTIGTVLVVAATALAKRMLREGLPLLLDPGGRVGGAFQRGLSLSPDALRLGEFWGGLLLELAIVAAALVSLLLVWGATVEDVLVLWQRLIDGVRVGSYTFSLADLLLAILVLVVALSATRYVQRVLDHRVFPGTSLDAGIRHSLRSGVGYLGLVVGAAMAITTLGLNVSNLAFVAGALTVGIGFGLQNIVNNFVSGLILLIERPIKQGDWIVVGGKEGIVKRINVRATEIETFSHSTLLVPNSEFLQTHVLNWTHRNPLARIDIGVKVPAHAFDAASARALLLECIAAHGDLLPTPAPRVLLQDFDAATYAFEVQVHVRDVAQMEEVASQIRFAADAAIRSRMPPGLAPAAPAVPPASR